MTGIPNGFYSSEKYPEYTLEGLTKDERATIDALAGKLPANLIILALAPTASS